MTAYCSITNLVTNSARAAVTLRPEAGAEAGDDAPVLLKQGCCCCRRHHYRHRHRHHHRHRPLRPRPVLLPLANCEVNLPSFRLWEEALLLPLGERRRMDTAEKGMTGGAAAGSMDRMHTGGCRPAVLTSSGSSDCGIKNGSLQSVTRTCNNVLKVCHTENVMSPCNWS